MSREYGSSPAFTHGYGGKPDNNNRHYIRGGRGGRGRGGGSSAASLGLLPEPYIKKGLDTSKIIETVPAPPRPSESVLEDIPIENVQYVASYNWAETEQPTIVVPGTSVFPPSFLERYITHSRRVPRPTQARQLCGPDARSHSPCNPTTAPIS